MGLDLREVGDLISLKMLVVGGRTQINILLQTYPLVVIQKQVGLLRLSIIIKH